MSAVQPFGLAIVGCGYVADCYVRNASFYADLKLLGGFDQDAQQNERFCKHFSIRAYPSLKAVLEDPSVGMVLNLTNPRSHYAVTEACLNAGKHVYSEKPLGMTAEEAEKLSSLARERGLRIGCAPCGVLSDTAQTLWKAIKDGAVGKVRLVYANYDDGFLAPVMSPWTWQIESGAFWPAKDEFEVGCTYEHAGYFLTWLGAFFGPAQRVHAFSSCLVPDKGIPVDKMAPDFASGCIEYPGGIVARVTCGLVAPMDKSMTVIGDEGILFVRYLRNDDEPVYLRKYTLSRNESRIESRLNRLRGAFRGTLEKLPWPVEEAKLYRKYPRARKTRFRPAGPGKNVDFMRGPKEMVEAIRESRPHRLSVEFGTHIVDLVQALQYPDSGGGARQIHSRFDPIAPLPWS